MNTASRAWLPGTVGALVGVAFVAIFASSAAPVESGTIAQALLAAATLGRAVAEFTVIGFALGLLAFGLRRFIAHVGAARRLATQVQEAPRPAAITPRVVAIPRLADATASEFDDCTRPAFAPVSSLTEAQVERERALRRRGYANTSGHSARLR